MKLLTFIDCFIKNKEYEEKLINLLNFLNEKNCTIFLISNSIVNKDIQKKVDYFFYDKQNKFFNDFEFDSDTWSNHWTQNMEIHETFLPSQKHGLSVLYNLNNFIGVAKILGFTHFERFEWDIILNDDSFRNIRLINNICIENNKKSFFIKNTGTLYHEYRFDYFFSELSFFNEKLSKINCHEDYLKYLNENFKSSFFRNVEQYLCNNFEKFESDILLINNDDLDSFLPKTIINSNINLNYIPNIFNFCTTRLYHTNLQSNQRAILTFNYKDTEHVRKIMLHNKNGNQEMLTHSVSCLGCYVYDLIDSNIFRIDVFEHDTLIFSETIDNLKNHITFK